MWFGKLTMLGSLPNHTNGISITYTVRPEHACPELVEGSKGCVTFYDTIKYILLVLRLQARFRESAGRNFSSGPGKPAGKEAFHEGGQPGPVIGIGRLPDRFRLRGVGVNDVGQL